MSVIVQVSELQYCNADGIRVLEDIHLHVERGELVFLVGPAAAGKSVLLNLLAAQLSPQHGQMLVQGRNIARLGKKKAFDLRRRIGFLPQGFVPLGRTVLENVTFKLRSLGVFREQAEDMALAALERVGLTARLTALADELEPVEKLRLGIALSLCNEPHLLLFDEPFGDLDSEDRGSVMALLMRINARGSTILASTRGPLPVTANGCRVVSIVDGRIPGP